MTTFNGGINGTGGGSLGPSTVYGDLTVKGKIKNSDGTKTAPSYTFESDTKVGMFKSTDTGNGVGLSGGSSGGYIQVQRDAKAIFISGTIGTDSGALFTGNVSAGSGQLRGGSIDVGTGSLVAGSASVTSIASTGTGSVTSITTSTQPFYSRSASNLTYPQGSNAYIIFDTPGTSVPASGQWVYNTSPLYSEIYSLITIDKVHVTAQINWVGQDAGYRSIMIAYDGNIVAKQRVTCSSGEDISLQCSWSGTLGALKALNVLTYSNANPSADLNNTAWIQIKTL